MRGLAGRRAAVLAAFVGLVLLAAVPAVAACRADAVDLRGTWGEARFAVELADTPQAQARGLMHRESLGAMSGMLFVFEPPRHVSFWMKNTLLPLDMVFADERGVVTGVHENAIPGDLTTIPGPGPVLLVLEINGGTARRFGIGPGDRMRHPAIPQAGAAWPCEP